MLKSRRKGYDSKVCIVSKRVVIPDSLKFMGSGFGCYVGAYVKFGENVTIYPRVHLGRNYHIDDMDDDCMPVIGDNVTIYIRATILGGVKIGDNSIIGCHSLVVHDVPDNVMVYGVPAKVKRTI